MHFGPICLDFLDNVYSYDKIRWEKFHFDRINETHVIAYFTVFECPRSVTQSLGLGFGLRFELGFRVKVLVNVREERCVLVYNCICLGGFDGWVDFSLQHVF
jgi:hypothetical protein